MVIMMMTFTMMMESMIDCGVPSDDDDNGSHDDDDGDDESVDGCQTCR